MREMSAEVKNVDEYEDYKTVKLNIKKLDHILGLLDLYLQDDGKKFTQACYESYYDDIQAYIEKMTNYLHKGRYLEWVFYTVITHHRYQYIELVLEQLKEWNSQFKGSIYLNYDINDVVFSMIAPLNDFIKSR